MRPIQYHKAQAVLVEVVRTHERAAAQMHASTADATRLLVYETMADAAQLLTHLVDAALMPEYVAMADATHMLVYKMTVHAAQVHVVDVAMSLAQTKRVMH